MIAELRDLRAEADRIRRDANAIDHVDTEALRDLLLAVAIVQDRLVGLLIRAQQDANA